MRVLALLVAHQGGWDEVAYFLVPIVAALVLVRVAERRARRRALDRRRDAEHSSPHDDGVRHSGS